MKSQFKSQFDAGVDGYLKIDHFYDKNSPIFYNCGELSISRIVPLKRLIDASLLPALEFSA